MRPPRLAERLAGAVLPRAAREAVLGDLHERYAQRVRECGEPAARRWYRRQALGFACRVPAARAVAAASDAFRGFFAGRGWSADLRDARRALVREPGLTVAVVLVLGLASGAATAIFGVVHAILLRPLPFADPAALVMVWDEYPAGDHIDDPRPVSRIHYEAWRADRLLASAGMFESMPAVIDRGRWTERVDAALVTADLLPTLGVRPALGRLFTPADDQPAAPAVAILGYELWQSWFGGDPAAVGRVVAIDGTPTEIVGVMPREFWFYDPYAAVRSYTATGGASAQLWRPLAGRFADERSYPRYRMLARLRPGVTREQVTRSLAATERALPLPNGGSDGRLRVLALDAQVTGGDGSRLAGLGVAAALLLLVAAVNLAGLLVARFDARRHEFAVRIALGAGRGRIARALAVHGALLAAAGGTLGLALSSMVLPHLVAVMPRGLPLVQRVAIDGVVALFALGIAIVTGVAATIVAAVRLSSGDPATAIGGAARSVVGGRRRLTGVLTGLQVAVSLVLLIAATLLLRSLLGVYRADSGFDRRATLTFQSVLMLSGEGAAPDFAFFDRLESRLARLPGVEAVGSASILPFTRWGSTAAVRPIGSAAPTAPVRVDYRLVSPGYFATLRVALAAGRPFTTADGRGGAPVAIVNQAFVERYLGASGPVLGSRLEISRGPGRAIERAIVGVVANVKEDRLVGAARPIVYAPLAQNPTPMRQFAARTTGHPAALADAIRTAAAEVDRRQPLQAFVPMDTLVAQSLEDERFYLLVAGGFAAIAIVLSLTGLYGGVSFAVRQRKREVGVRIALGSSRGAIYRLILVDGVRPVIAGLLAGCVAAAGSSGLLRSLVHGIPAVDPVSYAVSVAAFAIVATAACLLPARRAAAIDPVKTLAEG